MARSTDFYERLGWSKSPASNENVTFIQLKGIVLGLFSRSHLAQDATVEDTPPGFSGVTLAYNVTSEIGVDAVVKFAVSCGATLVKAPEKVFWGGYSVMLRILTGICGKSRTIRSSRWMNTGMWCCRTDRRLFERLRNATVNGWSVYSGQGIEDGLLGGLRPGGRP